MTVINIIIMKKTIFIFTLIFIVLFRLSACDLSKPNIILVMTDDQGWGETGYYNHSVLKTPNLDAMAANGLRFDRFYAGAPNCSPTRASVLTGRSNDRTAVFDHGYPLRKQEKTIAQALNEVGIIPDQSFDIAVWAGLHCAAPIHRIMGSYSSGKVRVSPCPMTSDDDVNSFIEAVFKIAG